MEENIERREYVERKILNGRKNKEENYEKWRTYHERRQPRGKKIWKEKNENIDNKNKENTER